MSEHSDLLEIVRRPLSPDVRLEVPTSRAEYERVQNVLENEESKYPQLWFDGTRNIAIVVGPPSALHSAMADALMRAIIRLRNSRGLTTRGWDGALVFDDGNRETLMIAVEVGVSQSYESLRAAISWSVCEESRGVTPDLDYSSIQEENIAVAQAEEDFRCQLMERPYGPLVIIETYRIPDEDYPPGTILLPSRSFTIVDDGNFVGGDVPPDLQEVMLGDCIPDYVLSAEAIVAMPVNFFRRDWFDRRFQSGIVKTAVYRMRPRRQ
ncbi:hypothetical protein V1517DRAFT_308159 [Lipomyces orientalis]|uniref:Uncharacterized protein n=1 Tax=Lipomyces orientalis TaxID=1233043 RepID=A0ACC3TM91_9ASCO